MSAVRRLAGMPWWRLWGLVAAFVATGLTIDTGIATGIARESQAYLVRQLDGIAQLAGDPHERPAGLVGSTLRRGRC